MELPVVRFTDDDKLELMERWVSPEVEIRGEHFVVVVDAGFVFDGASIPRLLWRLCGHPLEAPRIAAALAHDWLYASHVLQRKWADEVYNQISKAVGLTCLRTGPEWAALRLFGKAAWNSHGVADATFALNHGMLLAVPRKELEHE